MAVKMTSREVMDDAPVIPVIVLSDVAHAVPLARALVQGGIRMLEVTLRTPAAIGCIEAIAREVPDAVAGAGTVRNASDAQAAVKAGARFIVSPGYTPALGRACRELGVAYLPGVSTGSEIMLAQDDGFADMKFFPAVPAGGVPMLKAWHGPFADVMFCPTGGVTASNARDFLALPNVACVGGSWIAPTDAIELGDWPRITRLAKEAKELCSN